MTPQVTDLQARVALIPGGSVTAGEYNALDALILSLDSIGVTGDILELSVPVGNILDVAVQRLIYVPAGEAATNWQAWDEVIGLYSPGPGTPASAVDASTLDRNSITIGVGLDLIEPVGLYGGFGPNVFGIQDELMPFAYEGPLFGQNVINNTLLLSISGAAPTLSFLPNARYSGSHMLMSGAVSVMGVRDGLPFISNTKNGVGTFTASTIQLSAFPGAATLKYSLVANAAWSMDVALQVEEALRACAIALGRPLKAKPTNRMLVLGDSLAYGTALSGDAYTTDGGPLYNQFGPYMGWNWDSNIILNVGIPGMTLKAFTDNTAATPSYGERKDLIAPADSPKTQRCVVIWLGPNDVLSYGATGASMKSKIDTIAAEIKALGGIPIIIGPVAEIAISGVVNATWTTSMADLVTAMNADAGYLQTAAPWDGSKLGYWMRVDNIPELADPLDTVGPLATRFVDGVDSTVHLTPVGYSYYLPRLSAIYYAATADAAPVFVSMDDTTGYAGQSIHFVVEATNTLTFSVVGLPSGLTLDENTGLITGTLPNATGSYPLTITAHGLGGDTIQLFTLNVIQMATNCRRTWEPASGEMGLVLCDSGPSADDITVGPAFSPALSVFDAMAGSFRFPYLEEANAIVFGIAGASTPMSLLEKVDFPVLATAGGVLTLTAQPSLLDFDALLLAETVGVLSISSNPLLTRINLPSLVDIGANVTLSGNTSLTNINLPAALTSFGGTTFTVNGAALSAAEVNAILIALNAIPGLTGKTINLAGGTNAAPTGAGAAAKAALILATNTVTTN